MKSKLEAEWGWCQFVMPPYTANYTPSAHAGVVTSHVTSSGANQRMARAVDGQTMRSLHELMHGMSIDKPIHSVQPHYLY